MRADVYGLLPVVTRQKLHGFAADFWAENSLDLASTAHHLVHAGHARSPEAALMAVGVTCAATAEQRPEAVLAYSLLLHVELAKTSGGHGAPAYAALLKSAWHETDVYLSHDETSWLEPELFEQPANGPRCAAILQVIAALEFSRGRCRRAYASCSARLAASDKGTARLHALRSVLLLERGEGARACVEAEKAIACVGEEDTMGPYSIIMSTSTEAACLARASMASAATDTKIAASYLRRAARLIPRAKSAYATGFVLRAAARYHRTGDARALAALGAARAFDACNEPALAAESRATEALARVAQGRAAAATLALKLVAGPPAPRADAACVAAVAAVAKLYGDDGTYAACAHAAGDALERSAAALKGAPTLNDAEAPDLALDGMDPWLSLPAYLGDVSLPADADLSLS